MTLKWAPETAMSDLAHGRVDSALPAYEPIIEQDAVALYEDGEGGSLWGIFTYEEVEKAALDPETFSSVTVPEGMPRILPLMADPPEHAAYKRLFNSFFRPQRVADVEAKMRPIAVEMLESLIDSGTADFGAEFAYAFPTRTLVELIELEQEWQFYDNWSSEMEVQTRSGMRKPGKGLPVELFESAVPGLAKLVKERRENPGDDPISRIVTAGLDGEPISDEQAVGLIIALILAGRSTTASGIANLVLRLAADTELQQYLREHPERIPDAIEEGLRIDTPQQIQPRRSKREVQIGKQTIPAECPMFVSYGSANLDPNAWTDPDKFDIDREDKRRHMAFGKGAHTCPGAPLGRMQMRVTVEELLARTESFELAGEIERKTWPRLSVEKLPITFHRKA
ncbi:cytochrome P450 [Amycolatopsis pithecellobii]|uniref:Cytochrome P450 n=1 Tax=Amycolatopsis pithecellobii TaxID=664692 RepID=A0A6N7Z3R3_9PSEU|nr:cytochrome P450 [Amycolatopsis pithecellobii]MTD54754.1 cytochrome P450 [Amycolatopsis pithecellobii]